jgi:hypothetical protein
VLVFFVSFVHRSAEKGGYLVKNGKKLKFRVLAKVFVSHETGNVFAPD